MALFTSLPVYKLGYDVLIQIHKITKSFTREHKYTLGEKLKEESIQLLIQVYKANKSKKEIRLNTIGTAREHLETIRLLFRVTKDINVIGGKTYVNINLKIEELSKQLTAWQKYTARANA
ncbi:four helix bundle protein [Polaribacter sp. Z022]|uniref:four helix bundle protein n=1 Tax=Polaribacter sp. Z022 TaxID=2927125 RepID=UPI0020219D9A|nr:four helix bundle protein [Polaribacter sp. Z022]MCL7753306.1 four helix bundle protein [Polaribacter sp. Z022]